METLRLNKRAKISCKYNLPRGWKFYKWSSSNVTNMNIAFQRCGKKDFHNLLRHTYTYWLRYVFKSESDILYERCPKYNFHTRISSGIYFLLNWNVFQIESKEIRWRNKTYLYKSLLEELNSTRRDQNAFKMKIHGHTSAQQNFMLSV